MGRIIGGGDTETLLVEKFELSVLSGSGDTKTLGCEPSCPKSHLVEFPLPNISVQFNDISVQFNDISVQFNDISVQFNEILHDVTHPCSGCHCCRYLPTCIREGGSLQHKIT